MPSASNPCAFHGRVEGRVQGVSFRAALTYEAQRRDVAGWVRNLPDGTVEFVAQGEPQAVQSLLDWAETGPPGARVARLHVHEIVPEPDLGLFELRV